MRSLIVIESASCCACSASILLAWSCWSVASCSWCCSASADKSSSNSCSKRSRKHYFWKMFFSEILKSHTNWKAHQDYNESPHKSCTAELIRNDLLWTFVSLFLCKFFTNNYRTFCSCLQFTTCCLHGSPGKVQPSIAIIFWLRISKHTIHWDPAVCASTCYSLWHGCQHRLLNQTKEWLWRLTSSSDSSTIYLQHMENHHCRAIKKQLCM